MVPCWRKIRMSTELGSWQRQSSKRPPRQEAKPAKALSTILLAKPVCGIGSNPSGWQHFTRLHKHQHKMTPNLREDLCRKQTCSASDNRFWKPKPARRPSRPAAGSKFCEANLTMLSCNDACRERHPASVLPAFWIYAANSGLCRQCIMRICEHLAAGRCDVTLACSQRASILRVRLRPIDRTAAIVGLPATRSFADGLHPLCPLKPEMVPSHHPLRQ